MRGKRDLHPAFYSLCQLILLIALVLGGSPNARSNWLFFIPIFLLCIYSTFFCASESATADYVFILTLIGMVPTASDYILLRNRQPELRKIGQKKSTAEMTFTERLVWAASLLSTSRGIGWAHEPTDHIPARPTSSRGKFIASQLLWVVFYFTLFDATLILARENPCFGTGGPSLADFGWLWRTTSWLYVLSAYSSLSGLYATASIVFVATGLYDPGDCPDLFGSPLDAYTLRNCWGRVWHQILRRLLTSNTNFLANALHLPRGTLTTCFKLFTAFFISGLIHATGDYMLFQNFSEGTSIRFFLLQAVGITFEGVLIAIASRLGYRKPNAFFKLIGFAWVFAWFTFCLPMWVDPQLHAGTMDEGVNNVSIILGLTRGDWTPKRAPVL